MSEDNNTDGLDFEMDEANAAADGEPATPEQVTKANIAIMDAVESALVKLEADNEVLPDFNTDDGYADAKKREKQIAAYVNKGDTARLAATKWYRDKWQEINAMWKGKKADDDGEAVLGIEQRLLAIKSKLTAGIKEVDDEKKRVAQEAKDKETARLQDIEDLFTEVAAAARAITLDDINTNIDWLNELDEKRFEEREIDGVAAAEQALSTLVHLKGELERQAAEAKRLVDVQAEQDAAAEKLRLQQEAIDAQQEELRLQKLANEAEAQRLADEKLEREKADAQAEKDKETERLRLIEQSNRAEQEVNGADMAADWEREWVDSLHGEAIERDEEMTPEPVEGIVLTEKPAPLKISAKGRSAIKKQLIADDLESLTDWVRSIPALPEVKSEKGKAAVVDIEAQLLAIRELVIDLEDAQEEAA